MAQETLDLSTVPTLGAGGLEPRHVDLRAFVLLTGTRAEKARVPDRGSDAGGPRRQPGGQFVPGGRGQGHVDP